jgi:hypothetical protein
MQRRKSYSSELKVYFNHSGGVRKVSDAIEKLEVGVVCAREWRRYDSGGLVLRNGN